MVLRNVLKLKLVMSKYLYDENGRRYKREDDDSDNGGFYLFVLVLALFVAFAPGMVVTSLFASSINSSLWAWIWSVVFGVGTFFLVFWLYNSNLQSGNPWKWTIWTYVVLSGLSIWLLFASQADNIVRICKLLKLESIG